MNDYNVIVGLDTGKIKGYRDDIQAQLDSMKKLHINVELKISNRNTIQRQLKNLGGLIKVDVSNDAITKIQSLSTQMKVLNSSISKHLELSKQHAAQSERSTSKRKKDEDEITSKIKQQTAEINKHTKGRDKLVSQVNAKASDFNLPKNSGDYSDFLNSVTRITSLHSQIDALGAKENARKRELNAQLIQEYESLKRIGAVIKENANRRINEAKSADKYAKLNQELIAYMNKYGNEIRRNSDLYARFLALQNKMRNGSINFFDAKTEFANLTQHARKLGLEVDTIWKKLGRTFAARGRGLLSNAGWMMISRSLRDVWRNVVEIDTAMTELRKVTSATEQQYNQFLDGAKIRAQELGATLKDVVSATADYARLGYGLEDASTLADTALIYKNVGDGVQDINAASESIISTMQAFNIEAKDSMQIVDKFNAIGNNFATTSGDVGEALKRSASAMESANNSLDETIALYTAAQTTVQDADVVGRICA